MTYENYPFAGVVMSARMFELIRRRVLTPTDAFIWGIVFACQDSSAAGVSLTKREIAKEINITPSAVRQGLKRLAKVHLVQRGLSGKLHARTMA
jgi:hypothetical protein